MARPDFIRTHPRLARAAVVLMLCITLALSAYLGLLVHGPAPTGTGVVLEWALFLASLAASLAVLVVGARLIRRPLQDGPEDKDGTSTPHP